MQPHRALKLTRTLTSVVGVAGLTLVLAGCEQPSEGVDMAPDLLASPADLAGVDGSGADGGSAGCPPAPYQEDVSSCQHAANDYEPRVNSSANDQYAACVSDNGTFTLIGTDEPAAASRTVGFEQMAVRLWDNPLLPSTEDFLAARDIYSIAQGIGSRVDRRQDVHYPETPGDNKLRCGEAGVPEQYPDRCAGPARIRPIVLDAFQKGIAGSEPRVQAARLEASLLWFFYLSTVSEVWTCSFDDILDCNAAWGYFNGARQRGEAQLGPARYLKAQGQETFDRAFDGILAQRCWRDLDKAEPAANTELYLRSQNQLDRAELRGLALVLRARVARIPCASGELQKAHLEFSRILGTFLDRESRARNATMADVIKTELAAATPDVAKIQAALDALYPCP